MGPNVSNIIYSSFENLFNALCCNETLFVGSQCDDPNIVIYISSQCGTVNTTRQGNFPQPVIQNVQARDAMYH